MNPNHGEPKPHLGCHGSEEGGGLPSQPKGIKPPPHPQGPVGEALPCFQWDVGGRRICCDGLVGLGQVLAGLKAEEVQL